MKLIQYNKEFHMHVLSKQKPSQGSWIKRMMGNDSKAQTRYISLFAFSVDLASVDPCLCCLKRQSYTIIVLIFITSAWYVYS